MHEERLMASYLLNTRPICHGCLPVNFHHANMSPPAYALLSGLSTARPNATLLYAIDVKVTLIVTLYAHISIDTRCDAIEEYREDIGLNGSLLGDFDMRFSLFMAAHHAAKSCSMAILLNFISPCTCWHATSSKNNALLFI